MIKHTVVFILVLFLSLFNSTPTISANIGIQQSTLEDSDQIKEMSTDQMREKLKNPETYIFDARPHLEYAISHIPGAINVAAKPNTPASEYISDIAEIGHIVKGKVQAPIIIYCNGPFCGKDRRLSKELQKADHTNINRYQLGSIPVWRSLGEYTVTETEGIYYIYKLDKTAVWIDARESIAFFKDSLPEAKNISASGIKSGKDTGDIKKAKDDDRLPMQDHNTRIIVFADHPEQAKIVANALVKEAFHNVSYFNGNYLLLKQSVLKL